MAGQSAAAKKWEEVQIKAFSHWINTQLAKKDLSIESLKEGFSDGVKLIYLIEILTGKTIATKWTKNPKLRVHKINNNFIATNFLTNDCAVKGLTISPENLADGEPITQLLGFCWLLLRTFQEPATQKGDRASSFEAALLQWAREKLVEYQDINLEQGFSSDSWFNGKALLALVREFDKSLVNYSAHDFNSENKLKNCQEAIQLAEKHLKLPAIVDPVELAEGSISEKNLVLYLSMMYNSFKEQQSSVSKDEILRKIKDLEDKIRILIQENEDLRTSKHHLEFSSKDLTEKLSVLTEETSTITSTTEELKTELGSLRETCDSEVTALKSKVEELQDNIALLKSSAGDRSTQLETAKKEIEKERDSIREELKKTKAQLEKEKEDLMTANEELQSSLNKGKKAREELEEAITKEQEAHSQSIHLLRKHLLQHVHTMHTWKNLLEQDKKYESEDLHIDMEPQLDIYSFPNQVATLDIAIKEENEKLAALAVERKKKVKPPQNVDEKKKDKKVKETSRKEKDNEEGKPKKKGGKEKK